MRPPDIKQLLLAYLPETCGAPAYSRRPEGPARPHQFIRITTTGGSGRHARVLYGWQVTIDCYATSTGSAALLAQTVDEAMYALPRSPLPVGAVKGNSPSESPDPDTGQARYTATYQLTLLIS